MKRSEFSFELPDALIAQSPSPCRDEARLLVVNALSGELAHHTIQALPTLLPPGTILVPNDVKVRHARLLLRRAGGGSGEALLLRARSHDAFEALVRPGARLKPGRSVAVVDPSGQQVLAELQILEMLPEGLRAVRILQDGRPLAWDAIDTIGRLPLPPYIHHPAGQEDETRYQTAFHAGEGEAVAAPTAGLHFTPALIQRLLASGHGWQPVRLHVGLGTFRPMTTEDIDDHAMHEEHYEIPEPVGRLLEAALRQGRPPVCAVGTTSLRTLESAWDGHRLSRSGSTRIFIKPGYQVRTADHLLTNFHLPESTLFVLVCALLGMDTARKAYDAARRESYRFFSYGDAMLILDAGARARRAEVR